MFRIIVLSLLLSLGLTRRQVADLVTNGNYGFVQNVYARMMRAVAQTAGTVVPQLDYSFNRNFGVEIEAYNCTRERLARELRAAGISVQVEGCRIRTATPEEFLDDLITHGFVRT